MERGKACHVGKEGRLKCWGKGDRRGTTNRIELAKGEKGGESIISEISYTGIVGGKKTLEKNLAGGSKRPVTERASLEEEESVR